MATFSPFQIDLFLLLGFVFVGAASMLAAYRVGGDGWVRRFAIVLPESDGDAQDPQVQSGKSIFMGLIVLPKSDSEVQPLPGQLGEGIFLVLLAAVLFLINLLTRDVTLLGIIEADPAGVSIGAFSILLCTIYYSNYVCDQIETDKKEREKPEWIDQGPGGYIRGLRRGYWLYNLYSTVNFGLGVTILLVVYLQYQADVFRFAAHSEELRQIFAVLDQARDAGPEAIQSAIEGIYRSALKGASMAVNEIRTVFLVLISACTVAILLNFTPLRRVYEQKAVLFSNIVALVLIGIAFALAGLTYFNGYAVFIDDAVDELNQVRGVMETGRWEVIQRFNEIVLDLNNRQGIRNFLSTLFSGLDGVTILLSIIVSVSSIGPFVTKLLAARFRK